MESGQKAQPAICSDVRESGFDGGVVVLGRAVAGVNPNRHALHEVSQLGEHVLGEQSAVVGERADVPDDGVVGVPNVPVDRTHEASFPAATTIRWTGAGRSASTPT